MSVVFSLGYPPCFAPTLKMYRSVSYEERMKQKQQRPGKIGLEVGARIRLQEKRKEDTKERKDKIIEEEKESKK